MVSRHQSTSSFHARRITLRAIAPIDHDHV
jgi:hypothetical protein